MLAMTADDATTDAVSYVGGSRRSLIDHIIVSRDLRLGDISNDDAAIVRLDRSVRDFADDVSDHVPIVFRMILRGEPWDTTVDPPSDDGIVLGIPNDATQVRVKFNQ